MSKMQYLLKIMVNLYAMHKYTMQVVNKHDSVVDLMDVHFAIPTAEEHRQFLCFHTSGLISVQRPSLWVNFSTQGVQKMCVSCPRAPAMLGSVHNWLVCEQCQQQRTSQTVLFWPLLLDLQLEVLCLKVSYEKTPLTAAYTVLCNSYS